MNLRRSAEVQSRKRATAGLPSLREASASRHGAVVRTRPSPRKHCTRCGEPTTRVRAIQIAGDAHPGFDLRSGGVTVPAQA